MADVAPKSGPELTNRLLVTHHRAVLTEPYRSDDRIVISLETAKGFRVLKTEESVDGDSFLDSTRLTDTEPPFIHIRRVSYGTGVFTEDRLFSLSSDGQLYDVPIDNPIKVCTGPEMYKGPFLSLAGKRPSFWYPVGVYSGPNGPHGRMEGDFQLTGKFEFDFSKNVWRPNFRMVAENCHIVPDKE